MSVKVRSQAFPVRIWDGRVDPPLEGLEFGLDTETLAIRGHETPELVLLQVSNGEAVDIIGWEQANTYLSSLVKWNKRGIKIYMQNAAFDLRVLKNDILYAMLETDQIIDVGIRHRIHRLATQGFFEQPVSLAMMTRLYLKADLPKPKELRTGFTREQALTVEQLEYAALDALVTARIARAIPAQPTECMQTRADLVLDFIGQTGMLVDLPAWNALRAKLEKKIEAGAEKLRLLGFEPNSEASKPSAMLKRVCDRAGIPMPAKVWGASRLRTLLSAALVPGTYGDSLDAICAEMRRLAKADKGSPPMISEGETKELGGMLVKLRMEPLLDCNKARPYLKVMEIMLTLRSQGLDPAEALKELSRQYVAAGGWELDSSFIGPVAYMQNHLEQIEKVHEIQFPRTESGKKIKIGKDEMWRLEMKEVKDPLLEAYVEYKHAEKMLSTYLNSELIGADRRLHPHFNIMVRTGRTSCATPNLQNIPNEIGMRETLRAPDGQALVAVDYRQLELCSLAQHCYTTYGASRMRELINAGVDLHGWFAARTLRMITADNDYREGDPASLEFVRKIAAKDGPVPANNRQRAKAANFGFPGGMGVTRFLTEAYRHGMRDMTEDEARELRNAWFEAFPEMRYHMAPTTCGGGAEQAETKEDEEEEAHVYVGRTLTGRVRKYCTYNSACNFPFQGLAADGAKVALWNLVKAGFIIVNFVHDEVIMEIPLAQLHERTLLARKIMEESMATIIPDVRIGTEAAAMLRWSKAAKAVYDADGKLIPWSPVNETQ